MGGGAASLLSLRAPLLLVMQPSAFVVTAAFARPFCRIAGRAVVAMLLQQYLPCAHADARDAGAFFRAA